MGNPEKEKEDICFICSYWWQRIEECRQCLFNVLCNGEEGSWWTNKGA